MTDCVMPPSIHCRCALCCFRWPISRRRPFRSRPLEKLVRQTYGHFALDLVVKARLPNHCHAHNQLDLFLDLVRLGRPRKRPSSLEQTRSTLTLERCNDYGTFSTIFQTDDFEDNCLDLSTALSVFKKLT
jgi:hypothetical protein